jgi:3-deoxy-D-manno-octulosonate 8-phosphate phosphatase (KDO 8-P phosphatase)
MTTVAHSDFPTELARDVRLVILDVDGVLTDGGVYLGRSQDGSPVELKRFDIQDGLGIKLLGWAGIEVAIVSGRVSRATDARARELGIRECHQDPGAAKLPIARRLIDDRGLDWSQVAMVGDDLADLPVFGRVGLPVAPSNAVPEVLAVAAWVTRRPGGSGAVREFARELLRSRGQWNALVERYVDERGGDGAE